MDSAIRPQSTLDNGDFHHFLFQANIGIIVMGIFVMGSTHVHAHPVSKAQLLGTPIVHQGRNDGSIHAPFINLHDAIQPILLVFPCMHDPPHCIPCMLHLDWLVAHLMYKSINVSVLEVHAMVSLIALPRRIGCPPYQHFLFVLGNPLDFENELKAKTKNASS